MLTAWLIYLALGVAAGIMAGLLGIGGGLVLVAALVWLLPQQGVAPSEVMHVALATSLTTIVFTGMSSARSHHKRGSVLWRSVAWLVPGMLVGGVIGAGVATLLPGEVLRYCVAVFCLLAAAQLLFGGAKHGGTRTDPPASPGLTAAGVGIGSLSAIVGIGGGSMTVPLLVWMGVPPVRAVGTSSACGVAIAIASAVGYMGFGPAQGTMPAGSIGYVYLPAALGVAITSILAAPYGTRLAHYISGTTLKRVFAVFLVLVAMSVLLG